jgi:hypothetical protein
MQQHVNTSARRDAVVALIIRYTVNTHVPDVDAWSFCAEFLQCTVARNSEPHDLILNMRRPGGTLCEFCVVQSGSLPQKNRQAKKLGGGGADPDALCNLCVILKIAMKIMSKYPRRYLVRSQGKLKLKKLRIHKFLLYFLVFQRTIRRPISIADLG